MITNKYNEALKEFRLKMNGLKKRQLKIIKKINGKIDQKKIDSIRDNLKQYE